MSLIRPRGVAPVVVLFALTIRLAASAPQAIGTNSPPQGPARTGLIVGQVLDSTGVPVPEAIVALTVPYSGPAAAPAYAGRVIADSEGRFFFADLPPAQYYLRATKDGYVGGTYRQRRPSDPTQLLALGEGGRQTDVTLPVWKYGVISGTVVDEAGEPVVGVAVRALIKDIVGGGTRFGAASYSVPSGTTDDRGVFRLSQVPPGTYVMAVPSTETTVPGVLLDAQFSAVRNELFFAGVYELAPLGQPRTQQIGDLALVTLNSVLIPPPPLPAGGVQVYRTTFFPASTTARAATPISIAPGEERAGVSIALRPSTAVRISGRLVTPDGSTPPPTAIRLVGDAMSDIVTQSLPSKTAEVGFETVTGLSGETGRFTLLGVPPGEYVLTHANPFLGDAVRLGQSPYWFSQRITVGTSDVSNLTIDLRPPLRLEGRIELRSASGLQPVPPILAINGVSFQTPFAEPGRQVYASAGRTGSTPSFATAAAGGRYIASLREAGGWFVKSITLEGKDITDRPFDLLADATDIVVTYTDQPSKVSGTVKDARGVANPNATVLVFPIDPQRWTGYGSDSRIIKSVPSSSGGTYTFEHVPPGDYYLVAVDATAATDWRDAKMLETLARQASRLTVTEAEPKTVDLILKAIR